MDYTHTYAIVTYFNSSNICANYTYIQTSLDKKIVRQNISEAIWHGMTHISGLTFSSRPYTTYISCFCKNMK